MGALRAFPRPGALRILVGSTMNTAMNRPLGVAWVALATVLCCCGQSAEPPPKPTGTADAGEQTQGDADSSGASKDAAADKSSGGASTTSGGAPADASAPSNPSGATGSALGGSSGTGGSSAAQGGSATGGGSSSGPAGGASTGGSTSTGGATSPNTGGAEPGVGGTTAGTGGAEPGSGGSATGGSEPVSDPKGMTLYYVRHAQTVANASQSEQPSYEDSDTLTELGLRQIDALTLYLQSNGINPDAVLVSPTSRTQKTIEPYVVAASMTAEIWPELTECGSSEPTGAALPTEPTYYEYFNISIEAQNMVLREGASDLFWQTDTYERGLFMVMQARDLLLERFGQTGKTVLIAGHAVAGGVIIGLLRGDDMLDGTDDTDQWGVYMMNTGIQKLVQDPGTGAFTLEDSNINDPATE